jgi:hypothetical protein
VGAARESRAAGRRNGCQEVCSAEPLSKRASAVSIEDLVASIETARDKVMADEVKSLVKLGLPKTVAYKMVADRYRQRAEGDDGEADSASPWPDMS